MSQWRSPTAEVLYRNDARSDAGARQEYPESGGGLAASNPMHFRESGTGTRQTLPILEPVLPFE